MKRLIAILFAVIALAMTSEAQSPVRWRAFVKMTSPSEGIITLKAIISDGWHLYGMQMPESGPKPTSFDFSDSSGIKTSGEIEPSEAPIEKVDPLFGKKLSWWDHDVTFTQAFTLTDKKNARANISIRYMSCNGESCTPPKAESVSAPVPEYNPSQLTHHK